MGGGGGPGADGRERRAAHRPLDGERHDLPQPGRLGRRRRWRLRTARHAGQGPGTGGLLPCDGGRPQRPCLDALRRPRPTGGDPGNVAVPEDGWRVRAVGAIGRAALRSTASSIPAPRRSRSPQRRSREMKRNGTLTDADFMGERRFILADGRGMQQRVFRLRSLQIGDRTMGERLGHHGRPQEPRPARPELPAAAELVEDRQCEERDRVRASRERFSGRFPDRRTGQGEALDPAGARRGRGDGFAGDERDHQEPGGRGLSRRPLRVRLHGKPPDVGRPQATAAGPRRSVRSMSPRSPR